MFSGYFWRPLFTILILTFIAIVLAFFQPKLSCSQKNAVKVYGWNNSTNHEFDDRFSIYGVSDNQDTSIPEWMFDEPDLLCPRLDAVNVFYGNNATVHECNNRFWIYDASGNQDNLIAEGVFDKNSLTTVWVKARVKYAQKEKRTKRPPFESIGSFAEQNNINVDTSFEAESQKDLFKHQQLDHSEIYERGHLIPCGLQPTNSSRDATFTFHNVAPVRKTTNAMMREVEDYEGSVLRSEPVPKKLVETAPRELVHIVCTHGQVHSFSKIKNTFVPVYIGVDLRNNIDENGNYNSSKKIPVPEIIIKILIDMKKKKALAFLIPNSPNALDSIKARAYNINFQSEKFPQIKKELNKKLDNHEILAFCAYDVPDLFPGAPFNQEISDELKKYNIGRLKQSSPIDSSGPDTASRHGKKKHDILDSTIRKLRDLMGNAQILSI